jgi:hypothetical protein
MIGSAARLGAIALFASILLPGAAHAACKTKVFGTRTGPNAGVATSKAIQSWRISAVAAYGADFGNWLRAQNKGRSCGVSGALTTCRVWDNPCA